MRQDRWISRFLTTISRQFPTFVLYVCLLSAPCALAWNEDGSFHFAKIRFITGLTSSVAIATALALAASYSRGLRITITAFLSILTVSEFWTFFILKTRLSEKIIALVAQTDMSEASEFAMSYAMRPASLTCILLTVSAIVIGLILQTKAERRFEKIRFGRKILYLFFPVNILSIACIVTGICSNRLYDLIAFPSVQQLAFATNGYCSHRHDITMLENVVASYDAYIDENATPPQNIVWIIGESFNKYHATVYGYRLPTTPRLQHEFDNGNLIVFNNATTPSAETGAVMELVFSTHSDGDSLTWQQSALLPPLFRKAGYKVTLHDNQTTMVSGDPKWDSSNMYFFNSKVISNASFDYRNKAVAEFDYDFCADEIRQIPDSCMVLSIFHLMGQHFNAAKRYPPDFRRFSIEDYAWRTDLSDSGKAELAAYDNATAYNDSVIGLIFDSMADKDAVIIYHSDHGEEIHDFREHYGRTLEPVTPDIERCIYRIPMMIYTTPLFRQLHPDLYQHMVEIADSPFSVSDISSLLLEIASINKISQPQDQSTVAP